MPRQTDVGKTTLPPSCAVRLSEMGFGKFPVRLQQHQIIVRIYGEVESEWSAQTVGVFCGVKLCTSFWPSAI